MALIEINSGDDSFNRLIDRRVFENNVGCLATELERQFLFRSCNGMQNSFADFSRAGERDLIDIRMLNQRATGFARAGHDVDHAFGQFSFLKNFREMHRGDRRRLGRFQDTGISAGEGRREFPCRHQQRKIPGNDLTCDA